MTENKVVSKIIKHISNNHIFKNGLGKRCGEIRFLIITLMEF